MNNSSQEQAQAQLDSIIEMIKALDLAREEGEAELFSIMQTINEDPLEISVRSDWHTPGNDSPDMQYKILLCTGFKPSRTSGKARETITLIA